MHIAARVEVGIPMTVPRSGTCPRTEYMCMHFQYGKIYTSFDSSIHVLFVSQQTSSTSTVRNAADGCIHRSSMVVTRLSSLASDTLL